MQVDAQKSAERSVSMPRGTTRLPYQHQSLQEEAFGENRGACDANPCSTFDNHAEVNHRLIEHTCLSSIQLRVRKKQSYPRLSEDSFVFPSIA